MAQVNKEIAEALNEAANRPGWDSPPPIPIPPVRVDASKLCKSVAFAGTAFENLWEPVDLVLISDPGQDLDDEMGMVLLRCLEDLGESISACVLSLCLRPLSLRLSLYCLHSSV